MITRSLLLSTCACLGGALLAQSTATVKRLTLEQCLDMAMSQNHKRPASQYAVAMAEAQHRQALAAYWPQISGEAGYQRLSNPLNFLFPASSIPVPGQTVTIPGGAVSVTLPANSIFPGFPAQDMQVPVNFPSQTITTSPQTFKIPTQDVKVLDRNLVAGSLKAQMLLLDGGMRKGYREQTNGLIEMNKEEVHRTDLEVMDSVRRMYWGAVLARQLDKLGSDTLERMEMTLRLTETMFKGGSGKVNKSDYLDNIVTVETLRSMVAELEKNKIMAKAALAFNLGLAWDASVEPADDALPADSIPMDLNGLVNASYQFNPDWKKLEAGLRAAEGQVTTAKSDYFPRLGLEGNLTRAWNGGYDSGIATSQNLNTWTAKIGLEIPIFNGFLTKNKIAEARAQIAQIKENRFLLKEGLGLQIKEIVTGLEASVKSREASQRAMQAAAENRDLNLRAYKEELVETEKVIRSQLMEAFMTALHYKSRYDCLVKESELGTVVGTGVRDRLRGVVTP